MNVRVHIGRLVIDGEPGARREDLEAEIARELSRAWSAGELPALLRTSGAVPVMRGGEVRLGGEPGLLGERIGRGLVGCLRKV